MVDGREAFLAVPNYVSVTMDKPYVILGTLEWMKASGIYYDFLQRDELAFSASETRNNKGKSRNGESQRIWRTNSVAWLQCNGLCLSFLDAYAEFRFARGLQPTSILMSAPNSNLWGHITNYFIPPYSNE